MLGGKCYVDRKVVKAALGGVRDDKQSPFPSVRNKKRKGYTHIGAGEKCERETRKGGSLTGEIGGTAG